jgi:hypothetical protein
MGRNLGRAIVRFVSCLRQMPGWYLVTGHHRRLQSLRVVVMSPSHYTQHRHIANESIKLLCTQYFRLFPVRSSIMTAVT